MPAKAPGERAIVDIGSNTVRLVVFDGPERAPRVVLNEKVTAKLGKGVYETGALAPKAMQSVLSALSRYALLLGAREVARVDVVATAASRDAANGGEFLAEVAKLGFAPRLLSGEEEALASAQGVIGAFPGAKGVVADLGGGSLELVHVTNGECDHGSSLPFGSLRLPGLVADGAERFNRTVRKAIKTSGFECAAGETLYLVGGSHRALARFAMHRESWPLDDPHGYSLSHDQAQSLCRSLRSGHPPAAVPGLSASRTACLPHSAALLSELIREVKSAAVVFSSWGLREGLHFAQLGKEARQKNPLSEGVDDFAARFGVSPTIPASMAGWTAEPAIAGEGCDNDLRLAAITLALASQRIEPNLRAQHAVDWSLRKRWIGLDVQGRAMLAACALANFGEETERSDLLRLAPPEAIKRGAIWGSALRLCRRLTGGSIKLLSQSTLTARGNELLLSLDPAVRGLVNDATLTDLKSLAARLSLEPRCDQF